MGNKVDKMVRYFKVNGIKKISYVVIYMIRFYEMIIFILVVLKLGVVYILLDLDYLDCRINYIIENFNIEFIISNLNEVCFIFKKELKCINVNLVINDYLLKFNIKIDGCDLVIFIYIFGLIGKLKGIVLFYENLVSSLKNIYDLIGIKFLERVLIKLLICFIVSIYEIFWLFIYGGIIVVFN